uniref:Uncharacterized protein n=1 Tax=Arundo donax TaxID=35708 RepID=A0A0A9A6N9_ARUDO
MSPVLRAFGRIGSGLSRTLHVISYGLNTPRFP